MSGYSDDLAKRLLVWCVFELFRILHCQLKTIWVFILVLLDTHIVTITLQGFFEPTVSYFLSYSESIIFMQQE